jgi:fructokinase
LERDFARTTGRSLRGDEIVAQARQADREAQAAVARLQDRLARALAVVVDILDPDAIVLGGGLSRIDELYDGRVAGLLRDYGFGGGVTTPILRNLHGDSSGVRGAAWLWGASH